jgi:hypothetical protein
METIQTRLDIADDDARCALQRIASRSATGNDYAVVRTYLRDNADGRVAVQSYLQSIGPENALRKLTTRQSRDSGTRDVLQEVYTADMDRLRDELNAESATATERLVVQQVVETWSRLQFIQHQYDAALLGDDDADTAYKLRFWDRMLSKSQGRYLRAVETLSRIRRYDVQLVDRRDADGSQQRSIAIRGNG